MTLTNLSDAVTVRRDAWMALCRHAAASPDAECCGALLAGDDGAIVAAVAVANEAAAPQRAYHIGPAAFRQLEMNAADAGVRLAGFYHSHPGGTTQPSSTDRESALPRLIYLIVAGDAAQPNAAAWRLRDDRSTFERLQLTVAAE